MAKLKPGFSLLELLSVILVIGILSTLIFMSLKGVQSNARDARRVNDVKQMQNALELFFASEDRYPTQGEFILNTSLKSPNTTRVYMPKLPKDPMITESSQEYTYTVMPGNTSYTLVYKVVKNTGALTVGICTAVPGNICRRP
jgi:general secretion pathway protein G